MFTQIVTFCTFPVLSSLDSHATSQKSLCSYEGQDEFSVDSMIFNLFRKSRVLDRSDGVRGDDSDGEKREGNY